MNLSHLHLLRSAATFAFVAASVAASASTTVSVAAPPAYISPGQQVTLNVSFTKNPNEPEKRVVVLLELFKSGSLTPVVKAVADNNRNGYTGDSGSVPVSITIPPNASGSYYFKSWVVPWSLNRQIVEQYKTYPDDGTFTYFWDNTPLSGHGVTQDLYYLGSLISPKPPRNTTYCSGLAFDCALTAWNNYNSQYGHTYIGSINTVSKMVNFRLLWYGATPGDKEFLAALAVPQYDCGLRITDFEEAQEGDFIQLWRHSNSGHNPMFISWRRNTDGTIRGVNYWGSQGSTSGIGFTGENFGTTSGMNRERFYLARFRKPRDAADYTWALGAADTSATLSAIAPSSVEQWAQF